MIFNSDEKNLERTCLCGVRIIPAIELRPGYVIHWKHKYPDKDGKGWCVQEQ